MTVNELIEELVRYKDKFGDFDVQVSNSETNVTGVRFGNGCNFILSTDYFTPWEKISWEVEDIEKEIDEACDSIDELEEELDECLTEEASDIIDGIKDNLDSIQDRVNSISWILKEN